MFFLLSKLVWWLLAPLNALILLLIAGLALVWARKRRAGLWLITLAILGLIAAAWTPLPALVLHPLEERVARPERLPDRVDGIVLLGSAQVPDLTQAYGMPHMNDNAQTMTVFVALARRYPGAKRVFTGGSGRLSGSPMSEAAVVQLYFKEQDMDPASLIVEDRSRNTHENAVFAKSLVHPQPGERWLLITAAFHMPRALAVFRKAGWDVLPYPVSYRTLPDPSWDIQYDTLRQFRELDLALHEWIGLAAYWITGRI